MITRQIPALSMVFLAINTLVLFVIKGAPRATIVGIALAVIYLFISYILLRKTGLLRKRGSWWIIGLPLIFFVLDVFIGIISNGNNVYRTFGSVLFFGMCTYYIWNYSDIGKWGAIVILITPFILIYETVPFVFLFGDKSRISISVAPFLLSPVVGVFMGLLLRSISRKWILFILLLFSSYLYSFPIYHKIAPFLHGGEKLRDKIENANIPSFITQQGDTLSLKELREDIIILDFWFYGCAPCEDGFPKLEELHRNYINDPEVFISTARYFPGGIDKGIDGFEHLAKYSFKKLDLVKETQGDWGVSAFPTYLVFDKHRNLRYKGSLITGTPISERDIDRLIADLKAED